MNQVDTPRNKYITFKLSDWNGPVAEALGATNAKKMADKFALDDAVVIRGKDIFAAPTFFNYANQVVTVREIMANSFEEVTPELAKVLENLANIADHFHELGMWSTELEVGLPD